MPAVALSWPRVPAKKKESEIASHDRARLTAVWPYLLNTCSATIARKREVIVGSVHEIQTCVQQFHKTATGRKRVTAPEISRQYII